jgi:hypothetical protein
MMHGSQLSFGKSLNEDWQANPKRSALALGVGPGPLEDATPRRG